MNLLAHNSKMKLLILLLLVAIVHGCPPCGNVEYDDSEKSILSETELENYIPEYHLDDYFYARTTEYGYEKYVVIRENIVDEQSDVVACNTVTYRGNDVFFVPDILIGLCKAGREKECDRSLKNFNFYKERMVYTIQVKTSKLCRLKSNLLEKDEWDNVGFLTWLN